MPNILIRDMPVALHRQLKAQATAERRSMNQQILFLLEESLRAADKTAQPGTASTKAQLIDTGDLVDQDGPT